MLKYVSYEPQDLVARVRRAIEDAIRAKRMTLEESRALLRMYEAGLGGYTYLRARPAYNACRPSPAQQQQPASAALYAQATL